MAQQSGIVALSGLAPSTSLGLLWGTVDSPRRLTPQPPSLLPVPVGSSIITGDVVLQAYHDHWGGFSCTDGQTNVFLRIDGIKHLHVRGSLRIVTVANLV